MAAGMEKARAVFWKYLTVWVVMGAVSGCVLGIIFQSAGATDGVFVNVVKTPGDLFTNGLKCMLVPFIFSSMICSVFKLRTVVNGSRLGSAAFAYYLTTTAAAAVLAVLVSCAIIVPGVKEPFGTAALPAAVAEGAASKAEAYRGFQEACGHDSEVWCKVRGTLGYLVPNNIVGAMASSQLLGVMSFGVAVGLAIKPGEDGRSGIVDLASEVQDVMIRLMCALIAFTPFAVCSLLCYVTMTYDLSKLGEYIGWLLAAGFVSQFLQAFVVYPLLYILLTRKNPLTYIKNIVPALTTAFATASSAATFPWTLQCATESNGIPSTVANFVLPLGVTINMDGTCMTLIVSVFWLACSQGLALDFGKVLLMVITATVSSIGTAPIPSASLMYTGTIAEAAGVPLGQLFGVIVAVDWLRDRVRTCVNVMGDSIGVGILAHRFKEAPREEEPPEAPATAAAAAEPAGEAAESEDLEPPGPEPHVETFNL